MNAPSRTEMFILADGEPKLTVEEDTKIPNAATITINKEDHTLANMLRAQLLLHPAVIFAGYKVPHPLEARVVLKVQVDGSVGVTPVQAVMAACDALILTLSHMKDQFSNEVERAKLLQGAGADDQGYGVGMGGAGGLGGLEGGMTYGGL